MTAETRRSAAVRVIREFEGLGERDVEEACVITLYLVNNHISQSGQYKAH